MDIFIGVLGNIAGIGWGCGWGGVGGGGGGWSFIAWVNSSVMKVIAGGGC